MYRALVSFVCADFSMVAGETREIASPVAKDLLKAGYIAEIKSAEKPEVKPAPKKNTKKK